MENYDNWKLDTPDNHLKKAYKCDYCTHEIHEGEMYMELSNGDKLHEGDCFLEHLKRMYSAELKVAGEE